MRDHISGLQYIRRVDELAEKGLFVALGAYKYHVFLDFFEVTDTPTEPWGDLHDHLGGRGVPDIRRSLAFLALQPLHDSFKRLANPQTFRDLISLRTSRPRTATERETRDVVLRLAASYRSFLEEIQTRYGGTQDIDLLAGLFAHDLAAFISLPTVDLSPLCPEAHQWLTSLISDDIHSLLIMFGWTLTARLSQVALEKNDGPTSNAILRQYLLEEIFRDLFRALGRSEFHAEMEQRYIRAFVYYQNWWRQYPPETVCRDLLREVFSDPNMENILQVNEYHGVRYFNKESAELFVQGLFVVAVLDLLRSKLTAAQKKKELTLRTALARHLFALLGQSSYRVDTLLSLTEQQPVPVGIEKLIAPKKKTPSSSVSRCSSEKRKASKKPSSSKRTT